MNISIFPQDGKNRIYIQWNTIDVDQDLFCLSHDFPVVFGLWLHGICPALHPALGPVFSRQGPAAGGQKRGGQHGETGPDTVRSGTMHWIILKPFGSIWDVEKPTSSSNFQKVLQMDVFQWSPNIQTSGKTQQFHCRCVVFGACRCRSS